MPSMPRSRNSTAAFSTIRAWVRAASSRDCLMDSLALPPARLGRGSELCNLDDDHHPCARGMPAMHRYLPPSPPGTGEKGIEERGLEGELCRRFATPRYS